MAQGCSVPIYYIWVRKEGDGKVRRRCAHVQLYTLYRKNRLHFLPARSFIFGKKIALFSISLKFFRYYLSLSFLFFRSLFSLSLPLSLCLYLFLSLSLYFPLSASLCFSVRLPRVRRRIAFNMKTSPLSPPPLRWSRWNARSYIYDIILYTWKVCRVHSTQIIRPFFGGRNDVTDSGTWRMLYWSPAAVAEYRGRFPCAERAHGAVPTITLHGYLFFNFPDNIFF